MYSFRLYLPPPSSVMMAGNPMIRYSLLSSPSPSAPPENPLASSVTSLPWSDFLGITYSDIGAKSSKGAKEEKDAGDRERALGRERERERDSSARERDVMRFSGT